MGWRERLFGKGEGNGPMQENFSSGVDKPQVANPGRLNTHYRPSGSLLADEVARAVEEAAGKPRIKSESDLVVEAIVTEEERIRKIEREKPQRDKEANEVAQRLLGTLGRLNIKGVLQDVRENIWLGGAVSEPKAYVEPEWGLVESRLEFQFDNATDGYRSFHNFSQTDPSDNKSEHGYRPTMFVDTTALRIGAVLYEGEEYLLSGKDLEDFKENVGLVDFGGISILKPVDSWIRLGDGDDESIKRLSQQIVHDSRGRILKGELPVSNLIKAGRRNIREITELARVNGLHVDDLRPKQK